MREKAAVRGVPPLGWKSTADLTKEEWRHLRPIVREHVSPCRSGCPIGTRVEIFLDHVKKGKTKEAFFEIAERNPLPSTTGRVCYRFCEKECTREKFDRSLAIGSLERFVGDSALSERYPLDLPRKGREGKIAVVGSGPAGLSFAYQMRKRGFRVILYDRKGRPGGMLTHIIPEYRLPAGVPAAEITRLLEGGIEFVRREVSPREIPSLAREADALCVATGAWEETPPEGIRPDGRTVVTASSFLEAVRVNPPPLKGKPVAVIGGGNSAVDSARAALRLGGEVTVCYRRREADMPAYREEYEEAVKEGVEFLFCASPLRLERDG
ncbi:MAG: FAD-binding protein, partial [Deltaproteobacteria bacterium]